MTCCIVLGSLKPLALTITTRPEVGLHAAMSGPMPIVNEAINLDSPEVADTKSSTYGPAPGGWLSFIWRTTHRPELSSAQAMDLDRERSRCDNTFPFRSTTCQSPCGCHATREPSGDW